MQKINRPKLEDLPALAPLAGTLNSYCLECEAGTRKWRSSGEIYDTLKTELSKLTQGHCSFCDGYPFSMSKETIEHFHPKVSYKNLTYAWDNLFYCCDRCQSNANKLDFIYTLKPDDLDYHFTHYFWFDAQDGLVKVLENIAEDKYLNATNFLERYGINNNSQVLKARQRLYNDLILLLKQNADRDRNLEPNRYVFDAVMEYINI